jgi:hypothetical protein
MVLRVVQVAAAWFVLAVVFSIGFHWWLTASRRRAIRAVVRSCM